MIERQFLYGDLLFETIRVRNGEICFIDKHYSRLSRGAELLQFDLSVFSKEVFEEEILKKLGDKKDMRVRFVLYRNSEGFYTPETNHVKWETEIFPLDLQEKICDQLGIFNDYKKPCNDLSNLKSGNALTYVMAGIYSRQNNFSNCIILNEHGRVAETINSNIFVLRGDVLVTPPLSEGCVEGVMRQVVIEIAKFKGIFIDEIPVLPHELIQADEVFLTNAIEGVIPVKTFGIKKFPTIFASFLKSYIGF